MKIGKLLAVTLAGILAISAAACSRGPALTRYDTQFLQLFNTIISMVGYAKGKETFTAYVQELHGELRTCHQLYDVYHEYEGINNLKAINDNAGIEPVVVDEKIIDILEFAKELNARTNGYFNVAMGSVFSIWHEYRTVGIGGPITAELPSMEALKETEEHTDIDDAIIDKEASTVYLADADISLDVGVIAKGYTTEMVCRKLKGDGLTKVSVNMGENVRAIDTKDDGNKQRLGVQDPDLASNTKFLHTIAMADVSLMTSGDYQRYYMVGGIQYHYIVNPDTLMSWSEYDPVSILCKDSGMTDVLSTVVFDMKREDGQTLVESLDGVEAMWLYPDGSEKYSSDFQVYMEDERNNIMDGSIM